MSYQITKEQKQKVETKIIECVDKINDIYQIDLQYPAFDFRLKGGVAGVARSGEMDVSFNDYIFHHNFEEALAEVVPHEIAHLGVFQKSKIENRPFPPGHGASWKLMMHTLGVAPRQYHHLGIDDNFKKTVQQKIYEYICLCPEKKIFPEFEHRRIENGHRLGRVFVCPTCKVTLKNGQRQLPQHLLKASHGK